MSRLNSRLNGSSKLSLTPTCFVQLRAEHLVFLATLRFNHRNRFTMLKSIQTACAFLSFLSEEAVNKHFNLFISTKYSILHLLTLGASLLGGSDGKESACNAGDSGSIPRSGRSTGKGGVNPSTF